MTVERPRGYKSNDDPNNKNNCTYEEYFFHIFLTQRLMCVMTELSDAELREV